ncbi:BrnT family toxin [Duganella sp. FT80W]|uniref:BrnT family toxin n=1 Tax=Duganella guangzhouensis TaxID=2666084 RepID=A0A6I2KU91_9BURK|nr:BrnT family toxin [Duganella guangzhouensis]
MTLYTWDETKRESNLRKHGLDFADARALLMADIYIVEDMRFHYTEPRYNVYAWLEGSLVRITLEKRHGIRIISFRRASQREKKVLGRAR